MIKSSWFYVKFKYAEKVSGGYFLLQPFPRDCCVVARSPFS